MRRRQRGESRGSERDPCHDSWRVVCRRQIGSVALVNAAVEGLDILCRQRAGARDLLTETDAQGGLAPAVGLPQPCAQERLGAVKVAAPDEDARDQERGAVAFDEARAQCRIVVELGAAADPEGFAGPRHQEDQLDGRICQDVLEREEKPVALALGQQQRARVLDVDEARRVALGRDDRHAIRPRGGQEQHGRACDERARLRVERRMHLAAHEWVRLAQDRAQPLDAVDAGHGSRPYFIVGMTNSAPLRMPVGQRVVTVLRWV